jgi:hypothetical protein
VRVLNSMESPVTGEAKDNPFLGGYAPVHASPTHGLSGEANAH